MMETIFEKSQAGHFAFSLPKEVEAWAVFEPPQELLRSSPLFLPELSELDLTRHFIGLSSKNVGIDNVFIPLGSCTMKFNPRINEVCAQLPGFVSTHPYAPDDTVQGNLKLINSLLSFFMELTGMKGGTLVPNAGAQGELTGVKMIAAYHRTRGDHKRKEFLVPDSAHGTNPATVSMAGFEVKSIGTDAKGDIDLEQLKNALSEKTAGMLLTNPNTLGLFSSNILEITQMVHDAGGLVYYDGANLNPILTIVKPEEMGFDVMHMNLHKTFSTPHGGGGPGSGPVFCNEKLTPFLPLPQVECKDGVYKSVWKDEKSIGFMAPFFGNFGIYLRAYAYILFHGLYGLRRIAENAVLNANYLKSLLKPFFDQPYPQYCMHEFVIQTTKFLDKGVKGYDIAKRLLDYGVHSPTVYFPLIVKECFLIEPPETESKRTLDHFAHIMERICKEIERNPEIVRTAPHELTIGRLNETLAAKYPVLIDPVIKRSSGKEREVELGKAMKVSSEQDPLTEYVNNLELVATELMDAKIASEAAINAKNAFLATISHELRTPLYGIVGNVSLLLHTKIDESQQKYLTRIKSAAEVLMEIIGRVLDFSKIVAGEMKVQSAPFDLRVLVESCYAIMISKAEEKKLEIRLELPKEPLPAVVGDEVRLKQILMNLLLNGIKFTHNGFVSLRVKYISETPENVSIQFEIVDSGPGIPQEKMVHIFERFWQADSGNARAVKGTGLGLAISKELTTLMGGTISVVSKEGEGARFTVIIPFTKE